MAKYSQILGIRTRTSLEEGPLFNLPQAEMEGGQEDGPRPRMSIYALSSLPQPVVRGGAKREVARSRPHVWRMASASCIITTRER